MGEKFKTEEETMNQFMWSHAALNALSAWQILAILYFLTGFVVDAGREYFEGFSYNVSHSARYGDVGIVVYIILIAEVLKRQPEVADWMESATFHGGLIVLCVALGIIQETILLAKFNWNFGEFQYVDIYHNLAIMPLLSYLVLSTLPVIWYAGSLEKVAATAFLLIWAALLIFDIAAKRLEQRTWLMRRGFSCILKRK